MKRLFIWIILGFVFLPAGGVKAEIYSVKLVGSAQPGCWSLEGIVKKVTAGLSSDREKALALHRFGMAHQIHYIGPYEGGREVSDPLKLIGVYGYDLCGNNSTTMCALYNLAGLKARRRGATGHVVPEVWFEGKWNYIDTDMFGYVYLPDDKTLASVDELAANPDLWLREGRRPDPFFPWDPPNAMRKAFIAIKGWKDYHPYSLAHIMRLGLRTRESVTCYYRPRGRFYLDPLSFPEQVSTQHRSYWIEGPVRQNSMAWTDSVPASYGNGLFIYEPDLRSNTFRVENPEMKGVLVKQGDELPPLAAATKTEKATLVLELNTPWVIAGLQNDLTNFEDNTEGAVVSGWFWRIEETDQNRISLSVDSGRNWIEVWENRHRGAVPFRVDLTRFVQGRYGYKVKFEWIDNGGSGQVGLEGLKLQTWVELSPMALPRLETGKNVFTLSTSPHRAVLNECYWQVGESLPGERMQNLAVAESSPRLQPVDETKPGVLIFTPPAEGILDELRLSMLAQPLPGGKTGDISVVLSLSENSGASWQRLERFTPHPEHELNGIWFNHIYREKSLDGARTALKLTLTGCGLSKVAVSALVRTSPRVPTALNITHVYRPHGGGRQNVNWFFPPGAQNTTYEIEVPEEKIYNESFTIQAVPPESK